ALLGAGDSWRKDGGPVHVVRGARVDPAQAAARVALGYPVAAERSRGDAVVDPVTMDALPPVRGRGAGPAQSERPCGGHVPCGVVAVGQDLSRGEVDETRRAGNGVVVTQLVRHPRPVR